MFNSAMQLVQGGHVPPIRLALRARVPLAWATIGFALFGLIASFSPVHALLQPVLGTGVIHPLTAVCLAGLGGSVLSSKRYGRSSGLRLGLLGMILAVSAMRLMAGALVFFASTSAIPMFGPVAGFPGSFSLEIAIVMGAFAAAGVLRQGNGRWGAAALIIGLSFVFNMVVGGLFGGRIGDGSLGVLTLLATGSGALAMVSVYLHRPIVRVAFLVGGIGSQTRVMAAVVVAVPIAAAWVLKGFGASGGLTPIESGILSFMCSAMLTILLATSARHEGSVAARRRAERDIAMHSRTDELTGALNRFGMAEVVEGAWFEFKSTGAQFGMILLDLDYFRRLDATFGYDDGESVLGRVAQTVQAQLRGQDALGRWDKDEFMVLLKIKDYTNIAIVADRLRRALVAADGPFCAGLTMEPARMEIALGMSAFMSGDETAGMAITRADIALNDVKTTETQMIADLEADTPFDILEEPEDEKAAVAA